MHMHMHMARETTGKLTNLFLQQKQAQATLNQVGFPPDPRARFDATH